MMPFPDPGPPPPIRWWEVLVGGIAVAALTFTFFWAGALAFYVLDGTR